MSSKPSGERTEAKQAGRWIARSFRRLPRWSWVAAAIAVGLAPLVSFLLWKTLPGGADRTWKRIQETKLLRVCADPSWPPFEYYVDGVSQIGGLDVDLAQALAGRLVAGARAEVVTVGFDSLYDALQTGRCDVVISALPYEPARTQDVAYSVAYFNAGLVLVTRTDQAGIAGVEDLPGRVVGVDWGFVPEGPADQQLMLRGLGLRRYDTARDALGALQVGEVEAVLVDRISALEYERECGGVHLVGESLSDVNYVVALRLDSPRLLRETNHVLLEMRQDGTMDALRAKWF